MMGLGRRRLLWRVGSWATMMSSVMDQAATWSMYIIVWSLTVIVSVGILALNIHCFTLIKLTAVSTVLELICWAVALQWTHTIALVLRLWELFAVREGEGWRYEDKNILYSVHILPLVDTSTAIAPYEGQLRLQGGDYPSMGRVEIYCNGVWGTVCDDRFAVTEADTICIQLGYTGNIAFTNSERL